jgi:predicted aspartyl protease
MFIHIRCLTLPALLFGLLAGIPLAHVPVSEAAEQSARAMRVPVATIPFELTSDKPFVEVHVNGKPLSFVLDTGDNAGWVIATSRAEELGIDLKDEQTVRMGAGEGVEVVMGNASGLTFAVGDITMTDQTAIVFPLRHVAEFEGRPIDGLIGVNFFERYVVRIDYEHRRLAFYEPETFKYWGDGTVVPLEMLAGWPTVRSTIVTPDGRSRDAHFMVDTGVRMAVVFTSPYVEAAELDASLPDVIAAVVGGGIGGETRGRIGRLETMTLGDIELRAPVAVLSEDKTGALASEAYSGIVGGPTLRKFTVIFDYGRAQMILEPNPEFEAPFAADCSGLFLTANPPDFDRFQVRSVIEGSPAADVELQRGDRIVGIDGRPAGEFTLEELRVLLRDPRKVCRLKIERETRVFEIKLKLRPLL